MGRVGTRWLGQHHCTRAEVSQRQWRTLQNARAWDWVESLSRGRGDHGGEGKMECGQKWRVVGVGVGVAAEVGVSESIGARVRSLEGLS